MTHKTLAKRKRTRKRTQELPTIEVRSGGRVIKIAFAIVISDLDASDSEYEVIDLAPEVA